MYTLTIGVQDIDQKFNSFKEAAIRFFEEVRKVVESGTSLQFLETTCWLSCNDDTVFLGRTEIDFYDTRDIAYRLGIMKDEGKIIYDAPEPTLDEIQIAYAQVLAS